MKLLLNVALIAALGVFAGACTVVTDPSSGSSAASSGGSSSSASASQQTAEFAGANLERLKNDMAAGQGEYLGSLAALLGVGSSQQPAFFAFAKDKFTVLFPNERTTATEMLAALEREMRADPRFNPQLALN
ncbi:MAG: DUF3015 family protein [Candidatus Competibacter sp.]|nr:DUF3015 family protein [Candidatus Competibacter sp.]